jgi:hypothetical protein
MRFVGIGLAALMGAAAAHAQQNEAHEKAVVLAAAMKEAKVSLASALKSAEKEGTPISAKFELEDGKLQLSVYTMKGDKFSEVIVDHKSGKVVKSEPITGGEDLAAAKREAEAMGKTKRSLRAAVVKAEKANAAYKAVSVMPEIENGAPEAEVSLLKGTESKQVEEKL